MPDLDENSELLKKTADDLQLEPGAMAERFKEEGNDLFKAGDFAAALEAYNRALELIISDEKSGPLRLSLYKNRAFARLKLEDWEGAEADCDIAIELYKTDAKMFYRRALAREQLDKVGPAFTDAKEALRLRPGDKDITELCSRLLKTNAEKLKQVESVEARARDMLGMSLGGGALEAHDERRLRALNNVLVLCRESNAGAMSVWQHGHVVEQLMEVLRDHEKYGEEEALCAVRILDELAKSRDRAVKLVELLTEPVIARITHLRHASEGYVEAASTVIQRAFEGLAAMDRSKEIKPDLAVVERNKLPLVRLILELEEIITDPQYSAKVREISIDLLLKNLMHMAGGLPRGWSWRFVEERGLYKMLHIACQIPELCDYSVSIETRQHVAIFLAHLYDDMVFDQRRQLYKERVDHVFNGLLTDLGNRVNRIKLAALLITLLQGPVDIGISLVTNDQVTALMLQMAQADEDPLQQQVAVELIVLSVSKYERATNMIKNGLPVLKRLYKSQDENIRVRALVGLCKCAAAGGDDASRQSMEEGVTLMLADKCKRFLLDPLKFSVDVRRFACEGLSYLSLDADVKELIVGDGALIRALVELAKSAGAICVFTLAAIYVNCSNAYDKPEVDEEMVKLAQFAKHHVPQKHPKDEDEFVKRRIRTLVEGGAVSACVAVSKTESKNALDNLARCMLAFCGQHEFTGQIIGEGGARLLLTLFKECSAAGKLKAAHALMKLGTYADPNIAFAGQRMYEVVKPAVELLHPEVEGLANYDALLTLTNLASVSESVRQRILKERAIPRIEEFWFDPSHEELRAASAELLLNMLHSEDYFRDVCRPGTDKAKLWALYCDEGPDRLRLASSAGFALLTSDAGYCRRVLDELASWAELFSELAMAECPEVQRRCLMAIANMIECGDERVPAEIIASDVFRVLVAVTKLPPNTGDCQARKGAIEEAQRALDAAERLGLLRPTDRQLHEQKTGLSTVPEDAV